MAMVWLAEPKPLSVMSLSPKANKSADSVARQDSSGIKEAKLLFSAGTNNVALRTRIATEAGITSGDVKVSIGGLRAN